jgi:hypothetical protein
MRRRWSHAVAAVATVAIISGCAGTESGAADPEPTAARSPHAPTSADRLLTELRIAERDQPETYDRDAFGSAWADTDGNGCNQRDDVLLRDARPGSVTVAEQDSCDHDVLAGTWVDPYTGTTLTFDDLKDPAQAQAIQIDHVVPLAEAWLSGAAAWTDVRRVEFANDLSVLLAVDGPTNASKGASDPAAWRPRKEYQCAYARRWIRVKHYFELTVDASEVAALEEMLGYC